jgi:hypothetical protein
MGKWALESSSGRLASECDKVTPFTVFEKTIATPLGVLELDEIKREGDRWILWGHNNKTGKQWDRVIYRDITANRMTIEPIGGEMMCRLRKVAE